MAAKMATIVGEVTGPQQRHHLKNIPHLVKTPPSLVPQWGYEFACTSEVKSKG